MKACHVDLGEIFMINEYVQLKENVQKYNPDANFDLINKAYFLSKQAHNGQMRKSGEPYITHPVQVANILAEMEMDTTTIIAGMLHDTVEDTTCTLEEIEKEFGQEVRLLVDGVTKLSQIPYTTKQEIQAESLRKMFLAMTKDIRVIIIKLADRLHNMRTLKVMTKEKQVEKARETLEIYAPLAHRLGIYKVKWELEDLAFRYTDEKAYYDLVDKIAIKRKEREEYILKIINTVTEKTTEMGITSTIDGRAKHFYSIYRKMKLQNKTLEQIYDLFAIRVLVDSVKDCYSVLGLVHELFKPIPGRFKDYISMPKPNMYQSLHTTVLGPDGMPFEIQIRTWEMHRVSEVGIAAHWKYKESGKSEKNLEEKLVWLRQILEEQNETKDASEFIENLKIDLYTDEVFVFTPKGDVKSLRSGSTPIDFAYAVHSAVGNRMIGAKANNRIVTLDYELKNGDIIDIITSSASNGPSRDWLKIAKTSQAKNKINQWFKKEKREENVIRGKDLIEKELKKQGLTYSKVFKDEWVQNIIKKYNFNSVEDMFAGVGFGALTPNKIVSKLKEEYRKTLPPEEQKEILLKKSHEKKEKKTKSKGECGVTVKGIDNCLVRISKCCNPVPGDDIVGYITRGRGVTVHRKDCVNIVNAIDGDTRLIDVSWTGKAVSYQAELAIKAYDRTSLLFEITNVISEAKVPLKAINARTNKDNIAIMNITLEISDTEQLEKIIKNIRKIEGLFEVSRI